MSKKKNVKTQKSRDAPVGGVSSTASSFFCSPSAWNTLCCDGYRPLIACPEVQMCAGVYADLIGSMTIHLMKNTDRGDERVKNALSRKLDIDPNHDMVRQNFVGLIVWTLLLNGSGNQVTLPVYKGALLDDLLPLKPTQVSFAERGDSYVVRYGMNTFTPDEVLHFVLRPNPEQPWRGDGIQAGLREIVDCISQANDTRKALLKSPAPSIIVKVDGLSDEFSSSEGRKKLRKQYLDSSDNGEPWFIPSEAFSVEQVKPLSLNDLAIKTNLELDKRSIAAVFGVPPFLVGVGTFNADEFNWFVSTRVMPLANTIQQELTKKLLLSPDMYWRFNPRSLYSYKISDLVSAGAEMVDRMAMRRNEWRDWMQLPPDSDMDELLALENYIPADRLGDQAKLKGGEGDAGQNE